MQRDVNGELLLNSFPRTHPIGPLPPSTPWAMLLADDAGLFRFIPFDFDGKRKGVVDNELMEEAVDQANLLSSMLDELAIAHVVCESSGTGGRHVWIALRAGVDLQTLRTMTDVASVAFSRLDFGMLHNTTAGAVRPPLSPHRDGSASTILRGSVDTLLEPTATPADVHRLAAALQPLRRSSRATSTTPPGPIDTRHQAHRELSAAGRGHMATIAGGNDPSWTGFMCLLAAANAGWSFHDVERAAQTAPGMEHYRTRTAGPGRRRPRSAAETARRLASQWQKAQAYAALQRPIPTPRPPEDLTELAAIVNDVADLLDRLQAAPARWGKSEAGHSRRTILSCLAYLTLQTGKRTVAASIRDLALMSGLGRTTAAGALLALEAQGFIHRGTTADGSNASEWRLPPHFSTAPGTVRSQLPLRDNAAPPTGLFNAREGLLDRLESELTEGRHDLFTRNGIGHAAGKVYALLKEYQDLTIAAVAGLLGITTRYAATVMSRLRRHKLLVKGEEGWSRSKRDLRDHAARIIGVAGTLLERAERYRTEREVWAWWQAEVEHMNTSPRRRKRRPHFTARPLADGSPSPRSLGERSWPPYPRGGDGLADHREARWWVENGWLAAGSYRWGSAA